MSQTTPSGWQFVGMSTEGSATVLTLEGKLRGPLPPDVRERVLDALRPNAEYILDFSAVEDLSGIALRRLLSLVRLIRGIGGQVTARGASERVWAMAEASGFLDLGDGHTPASLALARTTPRLRIDSYPTHTHGDFQLRLGKPMPLGATVVPHGVNFAVYSRYATACTLVLYDLGMPEPLAEIPFPQDCHVGDVFAMTVFDLDPEEFEYGYRMEGPWDPPAGHRFDDRQVLLDPAARAVAWHTDWAQRDCELTGPRGRMVADDFDWEGDRPLGLPFEDLVIYEMHVRGFTKHPASGVRFPGTFAGLKEKIPYLVELGVNCVELLPVFEFDEMEVDRVNPETGEQLLNYWGYSTLAFNAPKASYAATGECQLQSDEFKALIKELHRNGIEVMLDVVFNHTSEGNEHGPTLSFRGLDNKSYYMLTPEGYYQNFSGCGNTLNCNHPVVREYVLSCLRYWVSEYHIDGFRFDLASILGRASDGTPLANPPLLEALALDPVLGKTKLIAEAWDAGGLYQVGRFPAYGRWAEWNGKFRDCSRKFLKGDMGQIGEVVQRFSGSPDLYYQRGPTASINFITCHDGFTLADTVSYNEKHNLANGEDNRDGANDNYSWNCGAEGPTDDPKIQSLRKRQVKNAMAMLFLSQGVPMLLMGDEVGRTQDGNNNTYCQDNELSWFDWTLRDKHAELHRFCRELIAFRKAHPVLRQAKYAGAGPAHHGMLEISWHGTKAWHPDWSGTSRVIAMQARLRREDVDDIVYVAFNMYWEPLTFGLPNLDDGYQWHQSIDTFAQSPSDIFAPGNEPLLEEQAELKVAGRSVAVLVAR